MGQFLDTEPAGAFDFGVAQPLYASRTHPRVLLGPDEVEALRARTQATPGRELLDALRHKCHPFVTQLTETQAWRKVLHEGDFFWPKAEEGFLWVLPDIAAVALLDADARALDAVRAVIGELTKLPTTGTKGSLVGDSYYIPPLFIPYAYDLVAGELAADERRTFATWAAAAHVDHVTELRKARYLMLPAHNMTLGGMALSLTTALAIEGDEGAPDLEPVYETLIHWFEATVYTALGPDGYPEEDIGYGTVVAPVLVQVAEALMRAGRLDAFDRIARLRHFGRAMLHFVQPWGEYLSNTGDHGDQFRDRQFALARLATRRGDPALRWLSGTLTYTHSRTFTADPVPQVEREVALPGLGHTPVNWLSLVVLNDLAPEGPSESAATTANAAGAPSPASDRPTVATHPTAFRDRQRGLVSFRSGWGDDDALLIFDGSQRSPAGPGHAHDSCGHFSLSALGEYFAIDTGRYNIEQNCHNVTLVNGRSGRGTDGDWRMSYYHGRLIDYRPGEFCDYAAVDSSHQHNCYWAWRHVGLVKGDGATPYAWTVDDINDANDWAQFWWQLHTSPENTIAIDGQTATVRGWRRGALLDVHFALLPGRQFDKGHTLTLEHDVAHASSHRYVAGPDERMKKLPRPAEALHGPCFARPRLWAKIAGYNGRFMSLMLPRRQNEPAPTVTQVDARDNVLAMKITFAEVEDLVIFAYDHHLLEAEDVIGRGQACVVRRARGNGRLLHHELINGERLEIAGQRVV